MIFCSICNDAFHYKCLDKEERSSESEKELKKYYVCKRCIKSEEKQKSKYKQLKLEETLFNKSKDKLIEKKANKIMCHKCNKEIKDNSLSSTCEKCKNIFHSETCFINNINEVNKSKQKKIVKILCEKCEKIISNEMHTTKISDFFKAKKFIGQKRNIEGKDQKENKNVMEKNKKLNNGLNSETKREIQICVKINKEINKNHVPEICDVPMRLPRKMPKNLEEKSMISLFRGLEAKGIEFNDDLVFIDKDCPKEMNNSLLENSIQILSEENKKIYYKFKENSRKGIYAPVEVVDDPEQRFIVKALDEMVTNTLICEYTGEVSLARNRLFDENDSIMDLIHTPTSDTSLVICPEKFGNLARFLSGINNKYKLLKKKKNQNVYSLRVNIDGSIHILLLTSKKIKKGEVLYYDYNAGGYNTYNTDHFV